MGGSDRSKMSKQENSNGQRPGDAKQPSLQARVQQHYGELPKSERKLADLILDFPGEIAAYSATELANLAGASKAAVTRLTRRLGYQSFEEARVAARDAQSWARRFICSARMVTARYMRNASNGTLIRIEPT
jgi:DNA-binding MurR/RpiR family transcriptional regulator